MEQFLPDGISGEDVITLLAAASAFLVMLAIWSTGIIKDGMDGKIKSLQERRGDLKRGYVAPVKRRQTIKSKSHVGENSKVRLSSELSSIIVLFL